MIILDPVTVKPIDPQREPISGDYVEVRHQGGAIERYYYNEQAEPQLIPLTIDSIKGEGLVAHRSDYSFVTLLKDTPVVVSATLPIPDSTFVLGVKRADGGYENFLVRVVDGKAEITLTLSQNNSYSVTEAELNRDLAEPMFSLETPIKIDVVTA